MMLLLSILIPLFISPAHDKPLATYELWVEEESIFMEVKFEKENLAMAIQELYEKDFSQELAEAYLISHTQWLIDDEEIEIKIFHFKVEHNSCCLKATLQLRNADFTSLEIRNTCLIDQVVNHSNVVFIHHQGKERAIRLSKKRTQTMVTW